MATYRLRVYVERDDGRIAGYSWDTIPDELRLVEEIEDVRNIFNERDRSVHEGYFVDAGVYPAQVQALFAAKHEVSVLFTEKE